MWRAKHPTGALITSAALLFATLSGALAQSPPSLGDAFEQGKTLGRSGNASGRSTISGSSAQSTVPNYSTNPPEAGYFGSPGLGTQTVTRASACASGPAAADPACVATQFLQTNPTRRPDFNIDTNDPLLTRSRAITADPQAIAGSISGTYSDCSVQTATTVDRFETAICHQYRTLESTTCDKVLIVTPTQTPGCSDGQFLTRVTANPCPACVDYLAFDFSCGTNNYLMHVFSLSKASGRVRMDLGSQTVPGELNTQIPKTPGPTRMNGFFCYRTYYSQSCAGPSCTISAWFYNPCQGTRYFGTNTFAMPTTVSFSDAWDNQCAALEARAQ